jgi:WhiB family redox-sensing transcriptional regulator
LIVEEPPVWDLYETSSLGSPSRDDDLARVFPLNDPEPLLGPLAWQELALCSQTDPEAFFPEKGGSTREAKRICAACEVRQECLEFALANDERFGIWGGRSERERRKLKQRRAVCA